MIGPNSRIYSVLAFVSLACLLSVPAAGKTASGASDASASIRAARNALEKYQDPIAAVRNGYFSTVACVDFPKGGTMDNRTAARARRSAAAGMSGRTMNSASHRSSKPRERVLDQRVRATS